MAFSPESEITGRSSPTQNQLLFTNTTSGLQPTWTFSPLLPDRSSWHTRSHPAAEETDDLAFDASDADVKAALEALENVGTVNVTREDGDGGGLYAWQVTFTEPALSAYSSAYPGDGEGDDVDPAAAKLSFPLLYAGGEDGDGGLGLGTLGAGGQLNVTRERRGTLAPLSGEVSLGTLCRFSRLFWGRYQKKSRIGGTAAQG